MDCINSPSSILSATNSIEVGANNTENGPQMARSMAKTIIRQACVALETLLWKAPELSWTIRTAFLFTQTVF